MFGICPLCRLRLRHTASTRSQAPIKSVKRIAVADIADKTLLLFKVYVLGGNRNERAPVYAREGFIGTMVSMGNSANRQTEVSMREKTLERKLVEAVKSMGGSRLNS